MWDTLSEPWQACLEELWAANCAGSVPHGAVVCDGAGRILARGRNRTLEPPERGQYLAGHRLAHAELNALLALDDRTADLRSCLLYTANEPCPLCIGAVAMAGIQEVRYAARDAYGGATSLLDATPLLKSRRIRVVAPERDDLETAVIALRVEWRLRCGRERAQGILAAAQRVQPVAVVVGEALFESEALDTLRSRCAPAPEMIDLVSRYMQAPR